MKRGKASRCYWIEILMGDGISPVDQLLKQFAAALVPRVQSVHFYPEFDSQSVKIGTDGTRMRIASTEAPIPRELRKQYILKLHRDDCDQTIHALGMKIPAEALKMRG